jgi:hypothetical protein
MKLLGLVHTGSIVSAACESLSFIPVVVPALSVWGLGFSAWCLGFGVQGSGFRV